MGVIASLHSKLLVKIFAAELASGRPVGPPLGTGTVSISSVVDSKGLFDAWIPLQGATHGSLVGEVHVVMLFTATRRPADQVSILQPVPAHKTGMFASRGGGGERREGAVLPRSLVAAAEETAPGEWTWGVRERDDEKREQGGGGGAVTSLPPMSSSMHAVPFGLQSADTLGPGAYSPPRASRDSWAALGNGRAVGQRLTEEGEGGMERGGRGRRVGDESSAVDVGEDLAARTLQNRQAAAEGKR